MRVVDNKKHNIIHRNVSFELEDLNPSFEALRIKSGIGGVMLRLTGEELRLSERRSSKLATVLLVYGLAEDRLRWSSMLFCLNAGLGARLAVRLLVRLSERIRLKGREPIAGELEAMIWPPNGDAMTTVPGVVPGGGVGLSVRKRG